MIIIPVHESRLSWFLAAILQSQLNPAITKLAATADVFVVMGVSLLRNSTTLLPTSDLISLEVSKTCASYSEEVWRSQVSFCDNAHAGSKG